MTGKTWFITGTSRGFGREWAIAALDRGDMVAATARDIASVDDLAAKYGDAILPIRLDVTDDGIGGATAARGSGLVGLKDRIEALGGTFSVHSPAGRGTTVSCQLPVDADGEQ